MSKQAIRYWLMKSEPDVFSIDDLARLGHSPWDGVRSYQARNHLQAMRVGDLALFYHSSTEARGVVGLARVVQAAQPDPSQFDPKSEFFDKGAKPDAPRWFMVDVEFVEKFPKLFSLDELKADRRLKDMLVVRRGMRLSVQPVELKHMRHVLARCEARTPL
jgi:predicted RNA-binding protein with PUA-like domain